MILTSKQIKSADSAYMKKHAVSESGLVETAAASALAVLNSLSPVAGKRILVLCGAGLNGADGYALAMLLFKNKANVRTYTVYEEYNETAHVFSDAAARAGVQKTAEITDDYDMVIDAVFGIGFHGELDTRAKTVFSAVSKLKAQRVSIDVPSGVYADSASMCEGAFCADVTVALCAKKPCHLLYPAKRCCGRVAVADMGFGRDIFAAVKPYMFELKSNSFSALLNKRDESFHKGDFGRAGLVVGSTQYRGAAVLSVSAALRCGAGIVAAAVPDSIIPAFDSNCLSAVLVPLVSRNGMIEDRDIPSKLDGCTALLCGSGIDISDGSAKAVESVARMPLPAVFDGDALTVIARTPSLLSRSADTVLTPHVGEFSRLCGKSVEKIKADRVSIAMKYAADKKCVLVLKDSVTVIALPEGKAFVLSEPTSALSKGGSGDVLAGMVCSFMAQGYSAAASALIAASLHNACGHLAEERAGAYAALPSDFINAISSLLK